jgi:hypothetical protein
MDDFHKKVINQKVRQGCILDDVLRELKNKINSRIKLTNNVIVNMLLFADDLVILQENKENLQKRMYELKKISNIYNFKIYTTKTKVMAFRGKYPIQSKIISDNNSIIEQVSNFNYLGCNVTYKYDEDLNQK